MKKYLTLLLAVIVASCERPPPERLRVAIPQAVVPDDRLATWAGNVGVPGGIPVRTTIYKDIVRDMGADPTGNTDIGPIVQSAINSCPAGQIVYIPQGTFKISSTVTWQNKSNSTLRGAGQGKTVIKIAMTANPFFVRGVLPWPPPTNWLAISSGATKGSTQITIADTTGFNVDMLFLIGPNGMPQWGKQLAGKPDSQLSWSGGMGGMFKVRSKTATTITFDPPLPFDFTPYGPLALASGAQSTVQGVGIESMTLDQTGATANFPSIQWESVWGCWIKDVEFKNNFGRIVLLSSAVRCEIRQCFTNGPNTAQPNHEGVDWGGNDSWNLVEDNIFGTGFPLVVFGDGGGHCMGNVVAYNYVSTYQGNTWDVTFNHGPHNMFNLCEGNIFQNSFKDDGYFGSSSHNTLLRNSIPDQVLLKHFSNYYNIIGNVLGALVSSNPNLHRVYETETADYWSSGQYPVYELGFPNIGTYLTLAHTVQLLHQIIALYPIPSMALSNWIRTCATPLSVMATLITPTTRSCGTQQSATALFRTASI